MLISLFHPLPQALIAAPIPDSCSVCNHAVQVLEGFDWAHHSMSVLLIEVYSRFDESYSKFLRARGLVRLMDFNSPTGLNQVWYNTSEITPTLPSGKQHSKQNSKQRGRQHGKRAV